MSIPEIGMTVLGFEPTLRMKFFGIVSMCQNGDGWTVSNGEMGTVVPRHIGNWLAEIE